MSTIPASRALPTTPCSGRGQFVLGAAGFVDAPSPTSPTSGCRHRADHVPTRPGADRPRTPMVCITMTQTITRFQNPLRNRE